MMRCIPKKVSNRKKEKKKKRKNCNDKINNNYTL